MTIEGEHLSDVKLVHDYSARAVRETPPAHGIIPVELPGTAYFGSLKIMHDDSVKVENATSELNRFSPLSPCPHERKQLIDHVIGRHKIDRILSQPCTRLHMMRLAGNKVGEPGASIDEYAHRASSPP